MVCPGPCIATARLYTQVRKVMLNCGVKHPPFFTREWRVAGAGSHLCTRTCRRVPGGAVSACMTAILWSSRFTSFVSRHCTCSNPRTTTVSSETQPKSCLLQQFFRSLVLLHRRCTSTNFPALHCQLTHPSITRLLFPKTARQSSRPRIRRKQTTHQAKLSKHVTTTRGLRSTARPKNALNYFAGHGGRLGLYR